MEFMFWILGLIVLGFVIWVLKSKTWHRILLHTTLEGKSSTNVGLVEGHLKEGQKGRCVSRLAPMGTVDFEGKYVEVHSTMDLINERTWVKIVKIEGDHIFVEKVEA